MNKYKVSWEFDDAIVEADEVTVHQSGTSVIFWEQDMYRNPSIVLAVYPMPCTVVKLECKS